jgi:hypothetical protein
MSDFLRQIFLKDFWLKLFSFALAVLTWFTVWFALARQGERPGSPVPSLTLPRIEKVTYANLPVVILSSAEDVRSFKISPKEVTVTVQGDSETLGGIDTKDIRVMADLTGIGSAQDMHKRIEVSVPAGITVLRVQPTEVQVIAPVKADPHSQSLSTNSSMH